MTPGARDRTTLIVTDLDRTMIYSRNAIGHPVTDGDVVCVEHYDGAPLSFMTQAAAATLRDLSATTFVVPATTRTVEQFARIDLPGAPWRYAITSNGGNILVDGAADADWRGGVGDAIHAGGAPLQDVAAALHARTSPEWAEKLRLADELFCYLVVRPDAVPSGFLTSWGRWCGERGWTVSQQGRKIYTMPTAVCKSRAVAEVRARLIADGVVATDLRVLAAGDGALDAEMLSAADAGIRPRHGELEALQWCHPTVAVTDGSGIVAAEQILTWFTHQGPQR